MDLFGEFWIVFGILALRNGRFGGFSINIVGGDEGD